MKQIRDAQTIIGMLEGGELNADLSNEISRVLEECKDQSTQNPKKKIKGSITLNLSFEVEGGAATVSTEIKSKTPKKERGRSFYWILEGGSLSTEHPQQMSMFNGPRAINE